MFRVDNYRVSFRRSNTINLRKNNYDTVCNIQNDITDMQYHNVAYLHPSDSYNKIIGKKIALTKTLTNMKLNKHLRTKIWNAFWLWVESWNGKRRYK